VVLDTAERCALLAMACMVAVFAAVRSGAVRVMVCCCLAGGWTVPLRHEEAPPSYQIQVETLKPGHSSPDEQAA
jgi:hypothetical protein